MSDDAADVLGKLEEVLAELRQPENVKQQWAAHLHARLGGTLQATLQFLRDRMAPEERQLIRELVAFARRRDYKGTFETIGLLADWLEDQLRPKHAGCMLRLIPQDGDAVFVRADSSPAPATLLREEAAEMRAALAGMGRRVAVLVGNIYEGVEALALKNLDEVARLDQSGIFVELLGEPEASSDLRMATGDRVKKMIQRLKRENRQLRGQNDDLEIAVRCAQS